MLDGWGEMTSPSLDRLYIHARVTSSLRLSLFLWRSFCLSRSAIQVEYAESLLHSPVLFTAIQFIRRGRISIPIRLIDWPKYRMRSLTDSTGAEGSSARASDRSFLMWYKMISVLQINQEERIRIADTSEIGDARETATLEMDGDVKTAWYWVAISNKLILAHSINLERCRSGGEGGISATILWNHASRAY